MPHLQPRRQRPAVSRRGRWRETVRAGGAAGGERWNTTGQCALVVGATFPAGDRAGARELVGEVPLLVPGIGAQGGDIEATVRAGRTASGGGLMINSSRAILYAGKGEDFAGEARRVALATREAINLHR